MKKLIVFILLGLLLTVVGCSDKNDLSKIIVTAEAQGSINHKGEVATAVYVTNNSDKTYNVQISVVSLDADGNSLDSDGFTLLDLEPGKKSRITVYLKATDQPRFKAEVIGTL